MAAVGMLLLVPCVCFILLVRSLGQFPDAYASDWTAAFVIEHVRTTGKWPGGWHDLRDEYDRLENASHYAWTFEELQQRVWLKWDVRLEEIRDAEPPMQVFRLTSGHRLSFYGDPNRLIRDYLRTGEDPHRVEANAAEMVEGP